MAIGDEFGLSEDLYHQLIGRYVSTIEVLVRRSNLKDQRIAILEAEAKKVLDNALANTPEPKEGDIVYGDPEGNPPA